ncbi:MAG: M43 family zinc metalloprotease [Chitinophagales bacterium]
MKYFITILGIIGWLSSIFGQASICLPTFSGVIANRSVGRSLSDAKVMRVNIHFMLKTDGSGNFNEYTDGDGRYYSGYDFARQLIDEMNGRNSWNQQMNIPPGNTTPVIAKNFYYVLDACYFWRNDATYNFNTIDYANQGKDKSEVINVFLSSNPGQNVGGYASNLDPLSKIKYTEDRQYWSAYKDVMTNGLPFGWFIGSVASNTIHEIGHLTGLSHTVKYNWSTPCPTGCPNSTAIDVNCDDGCNDTPSAWDITNLNNCTKHPDCGWWDVNNTSYCSNNVMDYSGQNALTPCQIGVIHGSLEGGMKTYLQCTAVSTDLSLCDIGYPKVSYFGKNVSFGCSATMAYLTNQEKIATYFSSSIELINFEVRSDSEFEAIYAPVCSF